MRQSQFPISIPQYILYYQATWLPITSRLLLQKKNQLLIVLETLSLYPSYTSGLSFLVFFSRWSEMKRFGLLCSRLWMTHCFGPVGRDLRGVRVAGWCFQAKVLWNHCEGKEGCWLALLTHKLVIVPHMIKLWARNLLGQFLSLHSFLSPSFRCCCCF